MKVAIIGCGGIAPLHVGVYKRLRNVKIAGLCDMNLEKAKSLAARFHVEKVFQDYWDMFDREDLDLVDVCTPVSTHARIVCDAAKSIPAILVEKPMALNVSECDNMINELKKHRVKFCVGHNQVFSPYIQKVKALINSGEFDLFCFSTLQKESYEILKAYNLAPAWNVSPEQKGIIWEVCCHLAYLQLYFLPDICEVYALGGKAKYPVYDDFSVLLRTEVQRFGIIELSWLSHETETIYEFRDKLGRRMQIHWEFNYFLENKEDPPFSVGKVARNIFVDEKRIVQKWLSFASGYFHRGKLLPTFSLISKYVESIEKDLPPPVSAEDGRNTVNLLESIQRSLDEHRAITVSN